MHNKKYYFHAPFVNLLSRQFSTERSVWMLSTDPELSQVLCAALGHDEGKNETQNQP